MAKRAFTFPGQGSQAVGMGKELAETFAEARAVFDEVDQALGQKLAHDHVRGAGRDAAADRKCPAGADGGVDGGGPGARGQGRERRESMPISSPAIRWASIRRCARRACFRSADTARLLRIRGKAMQQAVPVGQGAMAAILGLDLETVLRAANDAEQGEVCGVANDNAPGQVVISGHAGAVEPRHRAAEGRGRQARAAAAGERAVPLRADAPGGRCDGACAGAR